MKINSFLFDKVKSDEKSVEARIATPDYAGIEIGDKIQFFCGSKTVLRKIVGRTSYKTFAEMLQTEGINKCLPGVKSFAVAVEFYRHLFDDTNLQLHHGVVASQLELKYGVIAFQLQAKVRETRSK